ncbi:hypothetical protein PQ465_00980 [Sphingobacterium oryzagri]|uniref:Glycosyl transferase family 1 domain-containing protein n=1 Tax=Sphingobacterium oryzagri TaxID=3025669 RepID=A0ABY7WIG0_9SPHI|nr:glycosyltransferase [Sphingobacterium sp. KACC 22765]WDF68963.1 hypothetical protein PQ465_00980 [Sphingobacterium sp. KACC 22765]
MKEINIFSFGDSKLPRTWSNVPYLLSKTLEEKGYKINRLDINPNRYLQYIYNRFIYPITKLRRKDNVYLYERTYINYLLTYLRIYIFNKRYSNADLNITTNFSFYNRFSEKPNILLCDWDLNIGIRDFLSRDPYPMELKAIQRQKNVIEKSDLVISLFPKAAQKMRKTYENQHIYHLGTNVINSLYEGQLNEEEIIAKKKQSFEFLFVGSKNYIQGAKLLVEAASLLTAVYPDIRVNIVGISEDDFPLKYNFVKLYGYLDKNDRSDRAVYYDLMLKARIFINPTKTWGGYSSTIEAMYFYNPIIISPYGEFTEEFGDEISFGKYCHDFSVEYLVGCIRDIVDSDSYLTMCSNAHSVVENYTWDNYVDKILEKLYSNTSHQ